MISSSRQGEILHYQNRFQKHLSLLHYTLVYTVYRIWLQLSFWKDKDMNHVAEFFTLFIEGKIFLYSAYISNTVHS